MTRDPEHPLVAEAARWAERHRERASAWDLAGEVPAATRAELAAAGLLAPAVPREFGGAGVAPAELGEIAAHLGGICSALRGLLTVQSMVAAALVRWGTREQRARWLPPLTDGRLLAGFAATEEEAGSALGEVRTDLAPVTGAEGADLRATGRKKWITFGQHADVLLLLGRTGERPTAAMVDLRGPGVTREPVEGQLGMRAAGIAHLTLDGVRVPAADRIAPPGVGLSHVAATALDHGRFTVAWGCVGMAEACLADAARHAASRRQGGTPLSDHQSVRALLARAAVATAGARELCLRAALERAAGPGRGSAETVLAKYAAADAAAQVSRDAVQILGSAGCAPDSRTGRHFRDAKVMEIIEGAQQVSELHIAERVLRRYGGPSPTSSAPRGTEAAA